MKSSHTSTHIKWLHSKTRLVETTSTEEEEVGHWVDMQTVNLPFQVTGPDLSDDGVNKMKRAKKKKKKLQAKGGY